MIPPTLLAIGISAANDPVDGEIDIRCNLVEQDTSARKRCPAGQSALLDAMRSAAGLSVSDRSDDDDGVFTMPILVQNRSGFDGTLSLSHGELSEPEITTLNREIKISLSLSDGEPSGIAATPYKVDLAAKIKSAVDLEPDVIRSVSAPGKLFDGSGDTVYSAGYALPVSGDFLLLRERVIGSVSVAYTVTGQLQTASIPPREDAATGNYEASLWIASMCGKVDNYSIEVPECFQQDWWSKNGFPGDLLGGGIGDVNITSPPNYAEGEDISNEWLVCGRHRAANQETAGRYKDAPGTGEVYYPGVKESELPVNGRCKSEVWG